MNELEQAWTSGLRAGELHLPRCSACGAWNWYPLAACRACGGTAFAWRAIAPRGRLHSWTRVHRSFGTPPIPTPYLVGLVDLLDAPGVRIPCRLPEEASEPAIGADGLLRVGGSGEGLHWQFQRQS